MFLAPVAGSCNQVMSAFSLSVCGKKFWSWHFPWVASCIHALFKCPFCSFCFSLLPFLEFGPVFVVAVLHDMQRSQPPVSLEQCVFCSCVIYQCQFLPLQCFPLGTSFWMGMLQGILKYQDFLMFKIDVTLIFMFQEYFRYCIVVIVETAAGCSWRKGPWKSLSGTWGPQDHFWQNLETVPCWEAKLGSYTCNANALITWATSPALRTTSSYPSRSKILHPAQHQCPTITSLHCIGFFCLYCPLVS